MFARIGTPTALRNSEYCPSSVTASAKIISAPAATYASARSMAAVNPSLASASVRAIITNCSSVRASTAALIRSTISPAATSSLPGLCPQRFAPTWSSMCTAAAPAFSIDRIVRAMLNAPPHPVSISTKRGSPEASVIRRTSVSTSSIVLIPKSGIPSEFAATPPPERYSALNPVASAIRAVYALIAPATCSGFSSLTAARNLSPADTRFCLRCMAMPWAAS